MKQFNIVNILLYIIYSASGNKDNCYLYYSWVILTSLSVCVSLFSVFYR